MKCIVIHRGPGLLGPLVNIREACNSHFTWIFKDTLGLFHLTSQRGWSKSLYPHSRLIALSPNSDLSPSCTLLSRTSLPAFSHLFPFFFHYQSSVFPYPHVSHLPTVSSVCGSSELRSHWGRWRDEHLFFPPVSVCPAQPAGCQCVDEIEMRPTMQQLVLLWANHSQRADRGLIWFFTAWPYFSHQQREWPLNSSTPTLLIKFAPYAFEGRWTDWRVCFSLTPLPGASGLIRPQPWWGQALRSRDSIMFPKLPDWR